MSITTGEAVAEITRPEHRERPDARTVVILVRKELRDAVRDRWFWLYVAAFATLAVALTSITFSDSNTIGYEGFGRTAASLIALVQLVVPLMGLTLGARSIAGQRERGTLAFLLSHPVSRTEAFLGVLGGNLFAMLATVAAGFGVAGIVAAVRSTPVDSGDLVAIALLAWLLSAGTVGIGMLISVLSRRTAGALGTALFAWFVLVIVGDLGLMGTAVATRLPVSTLFFSTIANPVESFRMTAMGVLDGSLDVLGPAGTYAIDRFGDGVRWVTGATLLAWAVVPAAVALLFFRRGSDL